MRPRCGLSQEDGSPQCRSDRKLRSSCLDVYLIGVGSVGDVAMSGSDSREYLVGESTPFKFLVMRRRARISFVVVVAALAFAEHA